MQVLAQQLIDAAAFDTSRLVDFTESMQYNGAAMQLTPLMREAGCLAVTNLRIYFQPLHNVTSDSPVRVFALSDVAAMARRRSSLKPTGDMSCHDLPSVQASQCDDDHILIPIPHFAYHEESPEMQAAVKELCQVHYAMLTSRLCCAGLELFFVDTAGLSTAARTPSVFFAFRSELDRDRAAAAIAQQPSLGSSLPGGRDLASACGSILEVSIGQRNSYAMCDIDCALLLRSSQ